MPRLVEGSGGIIEIAVGRDIVWTNDKNRGYIPTAAEVLPAVRAALGE